MVMAFIYLLNTVLSYYDIDLEIFSYLAGSSVLTLLFLYISSYVFKFCKYHRMFIHYTTLIWALNILDLYVGIPINDRELLIMYLSITGIFLFVILYLYVKSHRKTTKGYS
nr:MAG TPA: hypothetical protein [Bacteriophage sp.]